MVTYKWVQDTKSGVVIHADVAGDMAQWKTLCAKVRADADYDGCHIYIYNPDGHQIGKTVCQMMHR